MNNHVIEVGGLICIEVDDDIVEVHVWTWAKVIELQLIIRINICG